MLNGTGICTASGLRLLKSLSTHYFTPIHYYIIKLKLNILERCETFNFTYSVPPCRQSTRRACSPRESWCSRAPETGRRDAASTTFPPSPARSCRGTRALAAYPLLVPPMCRRRQRPVPAASPALAWLPASYRYSPTLPHYV